MIATSHIENGAIAQMRMTPAEEPSAVVVCVVDDDPMMLRATISPQTHVIVITGREDSAARITAMQIGIVAFFIKPFNAEKFLAAVHDALNLAKRS